MTDFPPVAEHVRVAWPVGPWSGQRPDAAACLHFGAVQVDSVVTGEPLSKWCPHCDGTLYSPAKEADRG